MNVSLTTQLERFINEQVESGRYRSASEVVREAVRLLKDQHDRREAKIEAIRKALPSGIRVSGENDAALEADQIVREFLNRFPSDA
jgi:antitoxin ParD1/3/4